MILFRVEPYVARDYGRVEDMSNSLGVFIGRNKLEQGMEKKRKVHEMKRLPNKHEKHSCNWRLFLVANGITA